MTFSLSPEACAEGYRLYLCDKTGSTNTLAIEKAQNGDPGYLWVVAKNQTQGRGRYGRVWYMEEGNLAASLLCVVRATSSFSSDAAFVAGLSVIAALDLVCDKGSFSGFFKETGKSHIFHLKWPNDILSDGQKIAGILVETVMLDCQNIAIIVGIGVNIVSSPKGLDYPSVCLSALGVECSAGDFFCILSRTWVGFNALWNNGQGASIIRNIWFSCAR